MFSMADNNSLVGYKSLVNPDKHLKIELTRIESRLYNMTKGMLFHKSFISNLCLHMSVYLLNHTMIFFKKLGITIKEALKNYLDYSLL